MGGGGFKVEVLTGVVDWMEYVLHSSAALCKWDPHTKQGCAARAGSSRNRQ